jgi:recombination protein RecR
MAEDAIAELIDLLSRLPGIGERSAARLAYHVLGTQPAYAQALGDTLVHLHERVQRCRRCQNYTTQRELCRVCSDATRDTSLLCVVARPQDVAAVERSRLFRGCYHVLHGLLSPLEGVGPEALDSAALLSRVHDEAVREVIVATPLSVEGEATALFLAQELRPTGVRCTRIASGLPHGGELEYTDQVTLTRALDGRREL